MTESKNLLLQLRILPGMTMFTIEIFSQHPKEFMKVYFQHVANNNGNIFHEFSDEELERMRQAFPIGPITIRAFGDVKNEHGQYISHGVDVKIV